jgi:adenylate cyclase
MAVKILVVDDEPDLQVLIERRYRREIRHGEFEFEFADDGAAALAKIQEDPSIDLIISDINMPRMDGLTLLQHLGEFDDRLKTIIISAYGDMENIRMAMNRGAFDFVTKPIDFQDLTITIKKSLDQLDVLKEALQSKIAAQRARANLARYVPPHLVEILSERDEPFGPPRLLDVAVLFADMRGFTALSETMKPFEVMELLREFHRRMAAATFRFGGTIDDYIGDAILATFGVSEDGGPHAANALTCAREMLSIMSKWNAERVAGGKDPLGVGIGVNYGPAVVGDIGSERYMDFTVIGDTVNVASRLERLTRSIDTDLVVSQALADKVSDEGAEAKSGLTDLLQYGAHDIAGRLDAVPIYILPRDADEFRSCQ